MFDNLFCQNLINQKVVVVCDRYSYRGNLYNVLDDCVILENSNAVVKVVPLFAAETLRRLRNRRIYGHFEMPRMEDAIKNPICLMSDKIVKIYQPKWANDPLSNEFVPFENIQAKNSQDVISEKIGQNVAIICNKWQYRGVLVADQYNRILLENSSCVGVSGATNRESPISEKKLKFPIYIEKRVIEIFYQPNWRNADFPSEVDEKFSLESGV
jgi:hypothetical protein